MGLENLRKMKVPYQLIVCINELIKLLFPDAVWEKLLGNLKLKRVPGGNRKEG